MDCRTLFVICTLCLAGLLFERQGKELFAQEQRWWVPEESLVEEELSPHPDAIERGEKFDERIREPEEEAEYYRFPSTQISEDSVEREEQPVVISGPPAFPAASTLAPHEQVALVFVRRGQEAMAREEGDAAKEQFERAIEIAPLLPFSYYFLGQLAFMSDTHTKALSLLQKAVILLGRGDHRWRGEALRLQGVVYEDMGAYVQARAAYRQSLDFVPANLQTRSALARLSEGAP